MGPLFYASTSFLFALAALVPRVALASNPIAGCTEQTFEAACNHDGTSACSGVCLPDYSQDGAPMACVPADTMVRDDLGTVSGTEGYACSPSGAVGTDCTHSCKSGVCVVTNAAAGAECMPADGGANVCNGSCDGNGGCMHVQNGGLVYARDIDQCRYLACRPLSSNVPVLAAFVGFVPAGTACSNHEMCEVDDRCTAAGDCLGPTEAGCTPDYGDAGADDSDDASDDDPDAKTPAKDAGTKHDAGGTSTTPSTGGCDVGGPADFGLLSMGPLLALLWRKRRSQRGAVR